VTDLFDTTANEVTEGILQRIVFQNPDNGWTVARLENERNGRGITIVGTLTGLSEGESVRAHGQWVEDARFGRQFRVKRFEKVRPSTLEGIERYLASGLVKGVGPALAKRIVETFGEETLDVLEHEPHKLHRVAGLGKTRVKALTAAWREQKAVHEVMLFLQSHGVSPALAARIHAQYGQQALETVSEDPYRLCRDVQGIGFRTADSIARAVGLPADAPQRVDSGVLHALRQAADAGHCYLPRTQLLHNTVRLLDKDTPPTRPEHLDDALTRLQANGDIVLEADAAETRVFSARLHRLETGAASLLQRLTQTPAPRLGQRPDEILQQVVRRLGIPLAEEQHRMLIRMMQHEIMVLTGGPGTGKTTLVRTITDLFTAAGRDVVLCAPTGRAAKRLAESTGRDTWTLHRLLEWKPKEGGFLRNERHPLEGSLFIVDEASMVDLPLLHAFLRAVPPNARLLLVGDVDQLPSVGPGCILEDIIVSRRIPTQILRQVFRQAKTSSIVENAHRMRSGSTPQLPPAGQRGEFVFIERQSPESIHRALLSLVAERLPQTLGVDSRRDIQVLVPMNRGPLGTLELNRLLQERLNAAGSPIAATGLRVGDKVMQIRNNYTLETFNGDVGFVEEFDSVERCLVVRFDERRVQYDMSEANELTLAYACTVHKAQGSEYPVIVLVVHPQHAIMLQRNLLYTAVTRARQQVVLIGRMDALEAGLRRRRRQRRFTRLAARLRASLPELSGEGHGEATSVEEPGASDDT
jgi:exodeoxyribonuclease V alpha subunit